MRKKDYYAILGVSRTETGRGIRDAFRRLAKEHHPDLNGPEGTRRFQEITEAYGVLSDPEARESYNENLRKREDREKRAGPKTVPAKRTTSGGAPPEPLSATRSSAVRPFSSRSPGNPPLWDSDRMPGRILDKLAKGFFKSGSLGHVRPEVFEVEVILSRAEAAGGGILPLRVPVVEECRFCGGSGRAGFSPCFHCDRQGLIRTERVVGVEIPPGVREGEILRISLPQRTPVALSYRVHIRVRPN